MLLFIFVAMIVEIARDGIGSTRGRIDRRGGGLLVRAAGRPTWGIAFAAF
jgi:hypothetical protein